MANYADETMYYKLSRVLAEEIWADPYKVSPVPTGVLNNNIVILINATHCASGGECLEHAVSPTAMAMLEGLNNL